MNIPSLLARNGHFMETVAQGLNEHDKNIVDLTS